MNDDNGGLTSAPLAAPELDTQLRLEQLRGMG